MTVKELVDLLKGERQDAEVLVEIDGQWTDIKQFNTSNHIDTEESYVIIVP